MEWSPLGTCQPISMKQALSLSGNNPTRTGWLKYLGTHTLAQSGWSNVPQLVSFVVDLSTNVSNRKFTALSFVYFSDECSSHTDQAGKLASWFLIRVRRISFVSYSRSILVIYKYIVVIELTTIFNLFIHWPLYMDYCVSPCVNFPNSDITWTLPTCIELSSALFNCVVNFSIIELSSAHFNSILCAICRQPQSSRSKFLDCDGYCGKFFHIKWIEIPSTFPDIRAKFTSNIFIVAITAVIYPLRMRSPFSISTRTS